MHRRNERWSIKPASLPHLQRHCRRCDTPRWFVCTKKFRINAQQRLIDIWLVYRCETCDARWNLPIHRRRRVGSLNSEQLAAYTNNEERMIRLHAMDVRTLHAHATAVKEGPLDVERTLVSDAVVPGDDRVIELVPTFPCKQRLDRFLSQQLSLSRSELQGLHKVGRLYVSGRRGNLLRQPVSGVASIRLATTPDDPR